VTSAVEGPLVGAPPKGSRSSDFALSVFPQGHDPASLRESLLSLLSTPDGPYSSPGLQLLDREGGVGWHLLARLLAPRPAERISAADALRHPFLCGPKWRGEASLSMAAWMLGSMAVRITEEYVYNGSQKEKMRQLTAVLERLQQPDRRQVRALPSAASLGDVGTEHVRDIHWN
jgi:hypothetical protein